jgi:toxin CptA
MLFSAAVAVAVLCAGLMGYAIQRGATCTVAAVDELLSKRRANRLVAMGEASLWVAGGLALASVLHVLPAMPAAYSVSAWTFVGGALLGFGAWVNKACVFGAIARFGSGEWSYVATPLGFYAGCLTVGPLFTAAAADKLAESSPVLRWSGVVATLFVLFASWRVLPPLFALGRPHGPARADAGAGKGRAPSVAARGRSLAARVWAPHAATGVIGVTFVVILLLVGAWAYTDVLAQLARGNTMRLGLGVLCLLALYVGALLGGWTAGRLRHTPPGFATVARCFAGGMLMAWGTLLIPGSNDGLILIGMPLLWPYAWLAFATMCVTIGVAQVAARSRGATEAPGARDAPEAAADAG